MVYIYNLSLIIQNNVCDIFKIKLNTQNDPIIFMIFYYHIFSYTNYDNNYYYIHI
jgi:hypothetical protein